MDKSNQSRKGPRTTHILILGLTLSALAFFQQGCRKNSSTEDSFERESSSRQRVGEDNKYRREGS